MDLRSPHDDVPREVAHSPAELERTATVLRYLASAIVAEARAALCEAAARSTSMAAAESLTEEARVLLKEIVDQPEEVQHLGIGSDDERAWLDSLRAALERDIQSAIDETEDESLEMRARDLAQALAALCWDLDPTSDQRRVSIGRETLEGSQSVHAHSLDALGQRFELSQETIRALFKKLLAIERKRQEDPAALSAAQLYQATHRSDPIGT